MYHVLHVRSGRLLMGETNVETLPPENNTLLEEKFMGSVGANGETYLQDRSDVTKYNDSSNSRSRKSSPRDSSRKKSKSTMDRCNVDKSNESLNLNNFDDDQGKEKFGASSIFGSTESLFEERNDDDDDDIVSDDRKVGESTYFDSRDSIFKKGADDIFNNKEKVHKSANYDSMDSIFPEGANGDDSDRSQEITEPMTFDNRDSLVKERNVEDNDKCKNKSEYQPKDHTGVKPGVDRESQRGCSHGVRSADPYARETGSTHIEGIEQSARSNGMARKGSIFSRIANYIRATDARYQAVLVDILREDMEKTLDCNWNASNFNIRHELMCLSPVLGALLSSLVFLIITQHVLAFFPVFIISVFGSITYLALRYKKALKLVKYEQSRSRMVGRKSKESDTNNID
ncbi:hypothetical protein AK88_00319 [Plasmodium fragile]|uniref:Uncharacterized protein n=1 Tax=Plasmodium fragile TaxID=5857 RepID=A0A0D9QSW6_PLAFR|nr:uncharacterized protein AK88_00319 [Plasmodium fragile]KJP90150.1 hypothetical protein AK88_00319 [Plasmodium fragile]